MYLRAAVLHMCWPPKLPDWQKIHEGSELLSADSASERKRLFIISIRGFFGFFFSFWGAFLSMVFLFAFVCIETDTYIAKLLSKKSV